MTGSLANVSVIRPMNDALGPFGREHRTSRRHSRLKTRKGSKTLCSALATLRDPSKRAKAQNKLLRLRTTNAVEICVTNGIGERFFVKSSRLC